MGRIQDTYEHGDGREDARRRSAEQEGAPSGTVPAMTGAEAGGANARAADAVAHDAPAAATTVAQAPAPLAAAAPAAVASTQAAVLEPASEAPGLMDLLARHRVVTAAVLLVLAVISAWPLRATFSNPETYAPIIQTLDEKKGTVLALSAASAGLSAGISAIPGDAGTPVAEKLMDLSADFMIVLAAIYLETYLLTMFGFTSFALLFPAAFLLMAFAVGTWGRLRSSAALVRLAGKALLFGIVLVVAVPASVMVTQAIEDTYQTSVNATIEAAEKAADGASDAADAAEEESDDGGLWGFIQSLPEKVTSGVTSALDGAKNMVNDFIEALAVLIVTSCVIPLLVLVLLFWAAKLVLGVNVEAPMRALRPRSLAGKKRRA